MSVENLAGLILAAALTVFLVVALIKPERTSRKRGRG